MSVINRPAFVPLRVPCPVDGRVGPAVFVCRHVLHAPRAHEWHLLPSPAGPWGWACKECGDRTQALTQGEPSEVAAAEVADLVRPCCGHCIREAMTDQWWRRQSAVNELLVRRPPCCACGGVAEPPCIASIAVDAQQGPGRLVAAFCPECSRKPAGGLPAPLDESVVFVPDQTDPD